MCYSVIQIHWIFNSLLQSLLCFISTAIWGGKKKQKNHFYHNANPVDHKKDPFDHQKLYMLLIYRLLAVKFNFNSIACLFHLSLNQTWDQELMKWHKPIQICYGALATNDIRQDLLKIHTYRVFWWRLFRS